MFTDGSGFVMKRRAILEHLSNGDLTLGEYVTFDILLLMADAGSGVWRGSAPALAAWTGGNINERAAQKHLAALEAKGYIRRDIVEGKRGNYCILIDKYLITRGPNEGKRVCVARSDSAARPAFEQDTPGTERESLQV